MKLTLVLCAGLLVAVITAIMIAVLAPRPKEEQSPPQIAAEESSSTSSADNETEISRSEGNPHNTAPADEEMSILSEAAVKDALKRGISIETIEQVVRMGKEFGWSQEQIRKCIEALPVLTARDSSQASTKLTVEEDARLRLPRAEEAKKSSETPASVPVPTPEVPQKPVSSDAAIESRIDGEFDGWDGDTIFKLQNGQIWQQTDFRICIHLAISPKVTIYKVAGGWKMMVEGVRDTISVKRIEVAIESRIDGEFDGWEGDTIFKLQNGQIWQQTDYHFCYRYRYTPKVIICKVEGGWRMKVEGVSETIMVKRIK
jgi:hypothetical protein